MPSSTCSMLSPCATIPLTASAIASRLSTRTLPSPMRGPFCCPPNRSSKRPRSSRSAVASVISPDTYLRIRSFVATANSVSGASSFRCSPAVVWTDSSYSELNRSTSAICASTRWSLVYPSFSRLMSCPSLMRSSACFLYFKI